MTNFMRDAVIVPEKVATCPECECRLIVCAYEWEEGGRPTEGGLQVDCTNPDEDSMGWHQFYQSDWQIVIDACLDWVIQQFEEAIA